MPGRRAEFIGADDHHPVGPRALPPAPGWSDVGHRSEAPPECGRGPEQGRAYRALRVAGGQVATVTTRSRNTAGYLRPPQIIAEVSPEGEVRVSTDNLAIRKCQAILAWLEAHPRIQRVVIPVVPLSLLAYRGRGTAR